MLPLIMDNLNAPVRIYQPFWDAKNKTYAQQMPMLLAAGATPLSVEDGMQRRLEVAAIPEKDIRERLMQGWFDTHLDTAVGIAYNGDKAKIVLASPLLLSITPDTPLKDGALIITPEQYGSIRETELTRKQLERAGINDRLSKSRVVNHPGWQALVGGDKHLLGEYADLLFSLVKERYNENSAMGFYVTNEQCPSVRPWVLDGFDDRSFAYDRRHLDFPYARLVGVRTVASEASAPQISDDAQRFALYRATVTGQVRNVLAAKPVDLSAELGKLEKIVSR